MVNHFMGKGLPQTSTFRARAEKLIDDGSFLCFHGLMFKQQAEKDQRPFTYGILGLLLLNLFLFGDVLLNGHGRVLSSSQTDLFLHFTAWRQFGFDQLRQGHLVLWNPHYLCGSPFLGNFESALLYPLNWIYLLLPLAPAINIGIVLHVFLAGFFTYLWTYYRGLHPLACFTAGTVFMFGGAFYLHLYAGHLPNLCAMVWAPLLFLAIDGLVETLSLGWILLGIFAVSMQILAGHPQYVYFTAIISGIYTLLNLKGRQEKLSILGSWAAIYASASFLTAVQLWTGIGAFLECSRSVPMEYLKASSFSFPPQNILTLILPGIFGNLTNAPYWSQWFLWEVSLFVGLGAFFLILTAAAGRPKMNKWAFTMAGIAFLFSLGSFTPLYRLFYDFVPLFNGFRGISKFDFLAGLYLALLCGLGLDFLIKNKSVPRGPWFVTTILGLLFFGLEIWILGSMDRGLNGDWGKWFSSIGWLQHSFAAMEPPLQELFLQAAGHQTSLSLILGGGSCLLLSLLFFSPKVSRPKVAAVAAMAVLELFVFARSNRPTFELAGLQQKFDQIRKAYQADPGDYRVYGTGSASLVTGMDDIWEDEPMVLGRYGRFVCFSQGLSENQLFSVLPIYKRFHPVFGMMRLKYRVFMDRDPVQVEPMPFKALPRMLLLNQWEAFSDNGKILPALFDPSFNPAQKIFLEKAPNPPPSPGKEKGSVEWKDLSTDRIEISANVPQASLLLVTDNFSEGWRIKALPGSAQPAYQVMPANYFLRAIPLARGNHHFILEYRPLAFVLGMWVSLFSCLGYVGMIIYYFRKKT